MRTRLLLVGIVVLGGCGGTSKAPLVSVDARPAAATTKSAATSTWTVREGDSLRRIARKVYGDERLWTAIRDANPSKITRGDGVAAGAELTIPFDGM